jgi:hypothetical protein
MVPNKPKRPGDNHPLARYLFDFSVGEVTEEYTTKITYRTFQAAQR